jgi:hypothetical protein
MLVINEHLLKTKYCSFFIVVAVYSLKLSFSVVLFSVF